MKKSHKIAFLISHPIQYNSPLFRKIAEEPDVDLTVLYCSDESLKGMQDKGFGREVKWDIDLLGGYKYKFLKNHSPVKSIFRPPLGLINLGVVREIRKGRYDAVIVHGWHYVTNWLAFLSAFTSGVPVFLRSESPYNQEKLKPDWKLKIKKVLFLFLFGWIKAFLAIGIENKRFYQYYGVPESKIYFMPYAVDNERFQEGAAEQRAKGIEHRVNMGISEEDVVILFCGKLIRKKRPMDLLRAYEMIDLEKKTLVFAGGGELRRDLELYCSDKGLRNVHFTGFINQSELPAYYSMSDVFVLPSGVGETWGLVVNEAMNFSIPLVVSDVPGCSKDLVGHGENGFIYKEGDIGMLAGYLSRLLVDPGLRKNMGEKSLGFIKNYTYKNDIIGIRKALDAA